MRDGHWNQHKLHYTYTTHFTTYFLSFNCRSIVSYRIVSRKKAKFLGMKRNFVRVAIVTGCKTNLAFSLKGKGLQIRSNHQIIPCRNNRRGQKDSALCLFICCCHSSAHCCCLFLLCLMLLYCDVMALSALSSSFVCFRQHTHTRTDAHVDACPPTIAVL